MLNKRGSTLVETLLAFSIYIVIVATFIISYGQLDKYELSKYQQYQEYNEERNEREKDVCFDDDIQTIIDQLLP